MLLSLPLLLLSLPLFFLPLPLPLVLAFLFLPRPLFPLPLFFARPLFPLPLFLARPLFPRPLLLFPAFLLRRQRRRLLPDPLQLRGAFGDFRALPGQAGHNLASGRFVARFQFLFGARHILALELQGLGQRLALQSRLVGVASEFVVHAPPVEHDVHDQRRGGGR